MGDYMNSCLYSFGRFGGIFMLDLLCMPLGNTIQGLDQYFTRLRDKGDIKYVRLTKYLVYIKY